MRRLISLFLILGFAFACKTTKVPKPPPPAAALVDQLGTSVETAVPVPSSAASDEGAMFEKRWIYDRYGKFHRTFSGVVSENGRHYDEIHFVLPDQSEHIVYFDITGVYGATVSHTTR